jgi:hypothetical protein
MILRFCQSNPNFVESEEALRLAAQERCLTGDGDELKKNRDAMDGLYSEVMYPTWELYLIQTIFPSIVHYFKYLLS